MIPLDLPLIQGQSSRINNFSQLYSYPCEACKVSCQRFGKHRNGLRRFVVRSASALTPNRISEFWMRRMSPKLVSCSRCNCCSKAIRFGARSVITQLDRNTIMRLLVLAGERCEKLMDARMCNLAVRHLQIDEIWTYVQKKARHVRKGDSPEVGDQWVFVAIDADTKLVPAFHIGKRHRQDTRDFYGTCTSASAAERRSLLTGCITTRRAFLMRSA